MKKPPPPTPRFKKGDRAIAIEAFPGEKPRSYKVNSVIQEWVGGEWREYIGFRSGAGNADLFHRMAGPEPSAEQETKT